MSGHFLVNISPQRYFARNFSWGKFWWRCLLICFAGYLFSEIFWEMFLQRILGGDTMYREIFWVEISFQKIFGRELIFRDSLVEISPQKFFGRTFLFRVYWVDFLLRKCLARISGYLLRFFSDRDLLADFIFRDFSPETFLVENVSSKILG